MGLGMLSQSLVWLLPIYGVGSLSAKGGGKGEGGDREELLQSQGSSHSLEGVPCKINHHFELHKNSLLLAAFYM